MADPKEIEYWQRRPVHERFEEAQRLTSEKYGVDPDERLDRANLEWRKLPFPEGEND